MTTPPPTSPPPTSEFYATGATPITASEVDPRLHYCLYVPRQREVGRPMPIVVIMHGTGRSGPQYRDALGDFAERHGALILAPIFPAGLFVPGDLHNYKFIEFHGIRFDEVVLAMIDEVAARYPVATETFHLHGFSGGGQFAHRFLYLHPERLAAVSIGAPGRITRLDDELPWWLGTKDFATRFGHRPDIERMRGVAVQLVVGDADTETWEINNPGESNWMDGVEETGATRIERLHTLHRSLQAHGIESRLDLVPGVAHNGMGVLPTVCEFLAAHLR